MSESTKASALTAVLDAEDLSAVEDAAAVTLGMSVVHLPSSPATAER